MKNKFSIHLYTLLIIMTLVFVNCDDEPPIVEPPIEPPVTEEPDFTSLEYRVGYWLNTEGSDTMQFVNDSIYISRSPNYSPIIKEYYIEVDTFYLRVQGQSWWVKRPFTFNKDEEIVSFLTNNSVPDLPPINVPYKKLW